MKSSVALVRFAQIFSVMLLVTVPSRPGKGSEAGSPETVDLWKTNWVKKVVTNNVEIWIPTNRFVNEYHTNWTERLLTNTVDVYRTNWTLRTLTNIETVELFRTNRVTSIQTNWKTLNLTNRETTILLKTNWGTEFVTNIAEIDMTTNQLVNEYRTNWIEKLVTNRVTISQTNVKTLMLTNWETVILMKTNWVKELLTNVVEINLQANPVIEKEHSKPTETRSENVAATPSPPPTATQQNAVFALEATRTARPPDNNNRVEVVLKARVASEPAAAPLVQEWRVQRDDGSVVFFVKQREFKEVLPVGRYKVELKARQDAAGPLFQVRGTLTVTLEGVTVQGATTASIKEK